MTPRTALPRPMRAAILIAVALSFAGCISRAGRSTAQPPASASTGASAAVPTPARGFTILQVNDVYKIEGLSGGSLGGLARLATLRRELEAGGEDVVVVHGGDFLFPSVMSKYLLAQPMIQTMNLLDGSATGFDDRLLVTFGNHEFDHKDPGVVLGRVAQSDFRWLSTNVSYRTSKDATPEPFSARVAHVAPTAVLDLGGVRAGFFGLTLDDQKRDYVHYQYAAADRHRLVSEAIAALQQQGARVIVAITHQDMTEDVALAKEFPAIDVIAGGHEHFFQSRQVGPTWVTKADADIKSAIVTRVRFGAEARPTVTAEKRLVGPDIAKDPAVDAEVQRWLGVLAGTIQSSTGRDPRTVLATTVHELEGVEPAVRGRETALGNFLCDTLTQATGAEIALINGGAIRINDDIPAGGNVTELDLEGIFYFSNRVVVCELTGAEILDCLRASVSGTHLGKGGFFQVAGLTFTYHVSGSADEPAYRVEAAEVTAMQRELGTQAPLDPTRRYSVATLDYIWENGSRDGYAVFSKGAGGSSPKRLDEASRDWRELTVAALRSLPDGRITTSIEGRIRRVEEKLPQ